MVIIFMKNLIEIYREMWQNFKKISYNIYGDMEIIFMKHLIEIYREMWQNFNVIIWN